MDSKGHKPLLITRRAFLQRAGLGLAGLFLAACGRRARLRRTPTATLGPAATPTARPSATRPPEPSATLQPTQPPESSPTAVRSRAITANDFVPEQTNFVDVVVVLVEFSGRPERTFDLRPHWQKIFGQDDPIRQLNAYYRENFYGQLALRPVRTPQMGEKGYVEIVLPGVPQDYNFGWLVGMETENLSAVKPDAVRKLVLEIMSRVMEKHPEINYQDKFVLVVLDALGNEYGRGAAGFLPSTGKTPMYDIFVGEVKPAHLHLFSDAYTFRRVGKSRVMGIIDSENYTFEDYFRDREEYAAEDQFIRGMAAFSSDAPLSCASHDILHGLRRKSAYADPPKGRERAVNCLYNLQLQSKWLVGTPEHGRCDRSINCSPYIGWWDPMGDHLHPRTPREFFCSHPHGMSSFTKLRMGFIPDRCLAVVTSDSASLKLSPLGSPKLPPPGSQAETMVVKVPVVPGVEKLAHIYLLVEYRRRVGSERGEVHPDNFSITPDYVFGDKRYDPGYNHEDPAASNYVNPPMNFVPDEGVLVYLVNEKMPEQPGMPYTKWYNFVVALLNPDGNDKRDDLNHAVLHDGEKMVVDFRHLYPDRGIPVTITVDVKIPEKSGFAQVNIRRERLG